MPQRSFLHGRFVWDLSDAEDAFLQRLQVTEADVERIKNVPQRTREWICHRWGRLTASNFGAAAGRNPYKPPEGLVSDMLWSTFKGNAATKYGSDHEQVADDIHLVYLRQQHPDCIVWVQHQGLWVVKDLPMFGLSVDGLIHIDDDTMLLEIKCPYRKRFYPGIPSYYEDQIQGIMGFLDIMGEPVDVAHFVVYTPNATRLERHAFNRDYFYGSLLPAMMDWYRTLYLPAVLLYEQGLLRRGKIERSTALSLANGQLQEVFLAGDPPRDTAADCSYSDDTEAIDLQEAATTEAIHQDNIALFSEAVEA